MATSSKRTSDRPDGAANDGAATTGSFAGLPELTQRQMVAAVDAMSQLFSRYESMHRAQLHLAERAVLLHRQAADNLRKANSPMELASIQGTLVMYQFQEATRFWQEWMGAMVKAGSESTASATASNASSADSTPTSAAAAVGAAMSAAAPMAEAFQQMFMAPLHTAQPTH